VNQLPQAGSDRGYRAVSPRRSPEHSRAGSGGTVHNLNLRRSARVRIPSRRARLATSTLWRVKTIHEELHYDRAPMELFALISSGAFQLEIISHLGGKDAELVEETVTPNGGVKVVTRQRTGVELPGFAKKLIPASTTVTQTYVWEPARGDGSREGKWFAEIRGAPVSMGGPTELRAIGSGSVHVFSGEVKASVPVVGGKLESFALDNLRRDLTRAAEFTASRLAEG
jgi:hypothetical protein